MIQQLSHEQRIGSGAFRSGCLIAGGRGSRVPIRQIVVRAGDDFFRLAEIVVAGEELHDFGLNIVRRFVLPLAAQPIGQSGQNLPIRHALADGIHPLADAKDAPLKIGKRAILFRGRRGR